MLGPKKYIENIVNCLAFQIKSSKEKVENKTKQNNQKPRFFTHKINFDRRNYAAWLTMFWCNPSPTMPLSLQIFVSNLIHCFLRGIKIVAFQHGTGNKKPSLVATPYPPKIY